MLSITPVTPGCFLKTTLLRPSKIQNKPRYTQKSPTMAQQQKWHLHVSQQRHQERHLTERTQSIHKVRTWERARSQVRSNATRATLELSGNPHDGSIYTALSRLRLCGEISESSEMSLRHKNVLCTQSESALIAQ